MNFWSKDNNNPLSQSSIKEANVQVHAMHLRIVDLEQRVREQSELLERRDHQHAARFEDMKRRKDLDLANVQRELAKMDEKVANLEKAVRERDVNIAYLLHRCSYLDEAASYAPLLDQLSNCLKNAFAAPPPKVQTVKPTIPANVVIPLSDKQVSVLHSSTTTPSPSTVRRTEEK